MTAAEQIRAAEHFAAEWSGKGDEKKDCQKFWLALLGDVLGLKDVYEEVEFEHHAHVKSRRGFIDVRIPKAGVLIEQKSREVNLDEAIEQSDGSRLTPYDQALKYVAQLPRPEHPKWIVTSNFALIRIYDADHPNADPVEVALADLPKKYAHLLCLLPGSTVKPLNQVDVSVAAGKVVDRLYRLFLAQYRHPDDPETLKALNKLCVRLVFCAYCEDSGVFNKNQFHDYLVQYPVDTLRTRLKELFKVLATPLEARDEYLIESLKGFPYVAGGLFDEESEVPNFTEEIRDVLLNKTSQDFDWKGISPTIFGAIFESTLNPELRRKGGMHYTSVENIHKVIDPLFLDTLKAELRDCAGEPNVKKRVEGLKAFQRRLGALMFLDPACGSGNFLTETFLSLRQLENQAIALQQKAQGGEGWLDLGDVIHVTINQFYGIEINDFAVTVAKTAMWIAESQMMIETSKIVGRNLDFLPLKNYANILEGNALRLDWLSLIREQTRNPGARYDYIMGNPPFIGYSNQSPEQKAEMLALFVDEKGKPYKTAGKIDYVTAWYWKAAQLMQGTPVRAAFVSTNSITQGEQVAALWKPLTERFGLEIDFAWRTFVWDNEATEKAHVHCVIVGFHCMPKTPTSKFSLLIKSENCTKVIFEGGKAIHAQHINGYLMDGLDVFVESRSKPICDVPEIKSGGKPVEGGHLIFTKGEKAAFEQQEPASERWFRKFMGSEDFLHNEPRYCLWLLDASPHDLKVMPYVRERLERVREFRLASVKPATREAATMPSRFMEIKQPAADYLMVPAVSSERRSYIPMGIVPKDVIASNLANFVVGATIYHFGVLTSSVHMAWMRTVAGRLEMRYRYSAAIVYNNFPWPTDISAELKAKIEKTAQGILDARALYPDSSLADLYDELTMPPELRKAHRANDAAVCAAYGFPADLPEPEIVSRLFALYQQLTTEK